MTPDQLKASILQLAIQGKLVPQRPEEGTAEELYQQIQQEKKNLTAAGKLKKEKPLPPITEDEIPFDIPESWKWVRLPEIVYNVGDKTNQILAKEVKKEGAYPAVSQGQELIDGYTDESDKVIHDLPLVMFGDHTRNVKFVDFPFVISADGTKFMKTICIESKFLYYWMKSAADQLRNRGYARHFSLLKKELVPLPPLAEQRRIVEKIEQMLPLVEQYGEAYTALESLDVRFPDDMRKSILQYAIQGKLVPQLPEEGTAEDLYQQIQKEKKTLIAAGKLKKEKPLPPISEEEIPFDIPDSWKWVRLRELCFLDKGAATESGKLPYLEARGIRGKKAFEIRESGCYVTENTLVILVDGENSGEIFRTPCPGYMGSTFNLLVVIDKSLEEYIIPFMRFQQEKLKNNKRGAAIPHLDKKVFRELLVPLPPLGEQRRIVEKLEQMLPMIEQ